MLAAAFGRQALAADNVQVTCGPGLGPAVGDQFERGVRPQLAHLAMT